MKRILYLECTSGISGDMTAAALLDLGADREALERAVKSIPAGGFEIEISRKTKAAIDCCDFHVKLDSGHENHDHDMAYLYPELSEYTGSHGHDHTHDHAHSCDHEHTHDHAHSHDHEHTHDHAHSYGHEHTHDHAHSHEHSHHHHHEHRSFADVKEILKKIDMTPRAYETALRIFTILAEAEAKAHDRPVDEVHFHEVGAIDSIVDIVAVAVLYDSLDPDEVIIPALSEGCGTVRCQHGLLPIPVPAVANIAAAHHLTLNMTGVQGELVTPTGAAIAAAIRTGEDLPGACSIRAVGLGAGKRETKLPGFVRAMLLETESQSAEAEPFNKAGSQSSGPGQCAVSAGEVHPGMPCDTPSDRVWKLETDIDDSTGEQLAYCMELLFEAGALDVHYVPVYMKKNRPAYLLVVICREQERKLLEEIIFRETTTIGIRRIRVERTCLRRRLSSVDTPYGVIGTKIVEGPDGEIVYPEYESAAMAARRSGVSLSQVCAEVRKASTL